MQRGWVLFDCRHDLENPAAGKKAYRAGHLPGAQFLHLDEDLAGVRTGTNGRHPLPPPQALRLLLESRGVGDDVQVVAYDDGSGMFAARLWWLLRWLGHEQVAVLDGGMAAWTAAGFSLAQEMPLTETGRLSERPSLVATVDADEVQRHLGDGSMCLIDARNPERFRGENEALDVVGGHIPGARNRFFRENLAPDGRFKSAAELAREFRALLHEEGAAVPMWIVSQCGSGVTACHNLLAMEIAGLHGGRLYPGSWSEWSADPKRPVAKGA
ncbi:MAG: sulfurtransferase [Betaproteobacteria bacterium]|nr:sulfurtransferase [Betaproteobacteria bacterium]